jgi:hypothetical protein
MAAFLELEAHEIPSWLDQSEGPSLVAGSKNVDERDILIIKTRPARMNLVRTLMTLSLLAAALSAYFSYRPIPVNNEDDYLPITLPEERT